MILFQGINWHVVEKNRKGQNQCSDNIRGTTTKNQKQNKQQQETAKIQTNKE